MDRLKFAFVALLVASPAAAQQCGTLTTCPPVSTPLAGTELLYTVQGGVSKKMTVTQLGLALVPYFVLTPGVSPIVPTTNGGLLWDNNGKLADSLAPLQTALPSLATNQIYGGTGVPGAAQLFPAGAGVPAWLITPTSANLAAAVPDETGTGALVFANSPVFTTPNIGSATGHASLDCALAGCTMAGGLTATGVNIAPASGAGVILNSNAAGAQVWDFIVNTGVNGSWQLYDGSNAKTAITVAASTEATTFPSTVAATSPSNAGVVIAGGLGVGGAEWIGGLLNVATSITDQGLSTQGTTCNSSGGLLSTTRGRCANATPATSATTVASPTFPNSTSAYKMQGLAGAVTPGSTGNVLITISGTINAASATTVNNGVAYQISYGTGAAPTNNTSLAGTQIGIVQKYTSAVAPTAVGDVNVPFSVTYLVTGLTLGTAYWIDLAAESITTASDMGFVNIAIVAIEQ